MKAAERQAKLRYIEGLVASVRNAPRDADVWSLIGDVLLEAGQFEKAVLVFDLALDLNPNVHRAQIGLVVALDLCERDMTKRGPPMPRSTLLDVLQELDTLVRGLREGKRSLFVNIHAIRLQKEMERRLALDPHDADALFLKSAFLAEQGRFEDAVACVDALRQRNPTYPGAVEFQRHLKGMMARAAMPAARAPRRTGVPRS